MNYTAGQLAEITHSEISGDKNLVVENIAFDSRIIYTAENTAFIAINTSNNSGEKYINQAVDRGIKVIITENIPEKYGNLTFIKPFNSVTFLRTLAAHHLNLLHLKTIGITGSNGKTILKEWLFQSLWQDFKTVKSPKSFNSVTGLPLSILQAGKHHELGIFEVGISHPGEMKRQAEIFAPQIGVLTYIGSAHAGNFDSEDQLIHEKLELFKGSEILIYNGDNDLVYSKINDIYSSKKLISFGLKKRNNVHLAKKGKEVTVNCLNEEISFKAKQRDDATIVNLLALITVLKELGLDNEAIVSKIDRLESVEMRLEAVTGVRNNVIINDSFNLDLDSLKIALQYIKQYRKKHKSLVITDIVEGNSDADSLYKQVFEVVNQQKFDNVFLVGTEITKYQNFFQGNTYRFENVEMLAKNKEINELEDTLILLKGARKFEIERLKKHLEAQKHDTVLEVNLNNILHNINIHRSFLKSETKMMAMVKAFSYGLGGYEIAEFLQHHHLDYLGVAYADEGVELRKNGITMPIMVMNPEQNSYDSIIDYNLEPEIYSFRVFELFNEQLRKKGIIEPYPIHLKLETGMHRLGFKPAEIEQLIETIQHANVKVISIFTHLSTADVPEQKAYVHFQARNFKEMSDQLTEKLGYQPMLHILNSAGITEFNEYQYDMVRIGIGMMGISSQTKIQKKLHNVVTFKTVISQISTLEKGETLGYGRHYTAAEKVRVATIPVGYADGIPRLLGNNAGFVGIRNQLFPIIGNVCMDMMMIEIDNEEITEGEEVIMFNSKPTLTEFSGYCNTIPYEVLTSISRRVKRIYIKN